MPADSSSSSSSNSRPLNAFEGFFASFNVRFAVAIRVTDKDLDQLRSNCVQALNSCRLGSLRLVRQNEDDVWSMQTINPKDYNEERLIETGVEDSTEFRLGSYLEVSVAKNQLPADGPLVVNILYDAVSNRPIGVIVNACHALVDGRSLVEFGQQIVSPTFKQGEKGSLESILPDWKDMLVDSLPKLEGPIYLPSEYRILTISDILSGTSSGSEELSHEIQHDKIASLRQRAKSSNTTVTGLVTASLMKALASECGEIEEKSCIGVSLLVDLRPYLDADKPYIQIPQCHGTVTVSVPCEQLLSEDNACKLASGITKQLHHRIERGEAQRCALELCKGNFGGAAPPATIELSNLGVYTDLAEFHTAQFFEGYEGVSMMMHTDNQAMRIVTSVGSGVDFDGVHRVIDSTIAQLNKLTDEAGR